MTIWNRPFHELTYPIERAWRTMWGWRPLYWLRCHTFTRYHIIDIRGYDGYRWGWLDRDHAMYLACFAILCEYVEQEDPTVGLRTEDNYRGDLEEAEWLEVHRPAILPQLEREAEVRAIYNWWKLIRDREWAECYAMTDTRHMYPEMDRLEEKDEAMLMRLMKVRRCLWT